MYYRAIGVVLFAAVLAGSLIYSQSIHEPFKVSGFIEADEIRLGSRVGGRVAKVSCDEGDVVKAGALLVELEPFDLQEKLAQSQGELAARQASLEKLVAGFRVEEKAQAEAKLQQAEANFEKLENGPRAEDIAAAEAYLRLANSQLELAQNELKRTKTIVESKSAGRTQEDLDNAITQVKVAQENQRVREQELAKLKSGTRPEEIAEAEALVREAKAAFALTTNGYRLEDIAEAKAAVDAAKAQVAMFQTQLGELKVTTPVLGTVDAVELQPGDLVSPNAPVITLVSHDRLWVRTYVPENRLTMKIGDQVWVTTDSFPDQVFRGEVTFVSRQAEFTPGNVQTPEERSKQVFRLKVTLDNREGKLRPGMSADVWFEEPPAR